MKEASPVEQFARHPGIEFQPYAEKVYGWAYRVLGRHDDSLDVVQDVCIKWVQQCAKQAPDHPGGWLRRVALNRSLEMVRSRRPGALNSEQIGEVATADRHGEALDRAALRDDIAAAMETLTDAQRGVLVAKVYDEMTFAAIAEEMGLATSTVKTHYLRGLRAVRDRLKKRWTDWESL